MKNFKRFQLDKKDDFIMYLRHLIIAGDKLKKRFKTYLDQLDEIIVQHNLREDPNKKVLSRYYNENNDKINGVYATILNLIGDRTETAMSYKKFRELAERRDFGLTDLNEQLKEDLKMFNHARNWGLHIPESILNARLELAAEGVAELHENPLYVPVFTYYEGKWLIDLHRSHINVLTAIDRVFQQMKRDYSVLIEESMRLQRIQYDVRKFEGEIDIPRISFEMQLKKYKKDDD